MTEQAQKPISTRHVANSMQRKPTSSWFHRQGQPWSSTSQEQYTRADISGVRRWFLHQHCHHQPTGVGSRPAACMKLTGQRYPKQPRSARSSSLANAKTVWKSASARRPVWNAHLKTNVLNWQYTGTVKQIFNILSFNFLMQYENSYRNEKVYLNVINLSFPLIFKLL